MSDGIDKLLDHPSFNFSDLVKLLGGTKSGCTMWNGPMRNCGMTSYPCWNEVVKSKYGWPVREIVWVYSKGVVVPKGYWLYTTCGVERCSGIGADGTLHVFAAKERCSKKFSSIRNNSKKFPYDKIENGFWVEDMPFRHNKG